MSRPGNLWRRVHGGITKRPTNFSWIVENSIAGSGIPTSRNEFDWILSRGVRSVVTMTERALPGEWISESGVDYLHLPTPDMHAPELESLDRAADFIQTQAARGHPVMVHCAAGLGRAGTVLACYLVKYAGYTAERAISEIREKRPGSIQSDEQENAIVFFARQVDGIR